MTVTREGEAFAVASGLWLGGAYPVVVIQNTGLLESGDSLRGTAIRMGVPLLCLVTYRGYHTLPKQGGAPDEMTRADVDSVAVVSEPTLDAWRVPYEVVIASMGVVRPWGRLSNSDLDFAGMAKAAGFAVVHDFDDAGTYATALPSILKDPGPIFVAVTVAPESEGPISRSDAEEARYLKTSLFEWSRRFRQALR